jgi:hypothetical protein
MVDSVSAAECSTSAFHSCAATTSKTNQRGPWTRLSKSTTTSLSSILGDLSSLHGRQWFFSDCKLYHVDERKRCDDAGIQPLDRSTQRPTRHDLDSPRCSNTSFIQEPTAASSSLSFFSSRPKGELICERWRDLHGKVWQWHAVSAGSK